MAVGLDGLPGYLDPLPGGRGVVNAVDVIVNWARAHSLWPLVYGTSCCAIEMMATGAARHDIARFGAEVFRASPRQADLIILAGTLTEKMSEHLVTLYQQMPDPKWVIAMGACTISGGPFYYDSYSVVRGADRVVPVDVYLPGCPPRPEALLHALTELQAVIRGESIRDRRADKPIATAPSIDRQAAAAHAWAEEIAPQEAELARRRAAWKEANPDFKPYKHPRVDAPKLAKLARTAPPRRGTPPSRLWAAIAPRFPDLTVVGQADGTDDVVDALDQDPDAILELAVDGERYASLIGFLKGHDRTDCDLLHQITACDDGEHLDLLVHLLSLAGRHKVFVRCRLDRAAPRAASLAGLYPAAAWHEREVAEMFGVTFTGHPDPRRLFLADGIDGHPLRKDWSDPGRVVVREG